MKGGYIDPDNRYGVCIGRVPTYEDTEEPWYERLRGRMRGGSVTAPQYDPDRFAFTLQDLYPTHPPFVQKLFVQDMRSNKQFSVLLQHVAGMNAFYLVVKDPPRAPFVFTGTFTPHATTPKAYIATFTEQLKTFGLLDSFLSQGQDSVKLPSIIGTTQVFVLDVSRSDKLVETSFPIIATSDAQTVITRLNAALRRKCPDYRLELGSTSDLPGAVSVFDAHYNVLTLCLYRNNHCVSSIMLQVPEDEDDTESGVVEISSATYSLEEGRKYNRFLRACILLIAPHLRIHGEPVQTLFSQAVSTTSSFLFIKYYNVEFTPTFLASIKKQGLRLPLTYSQLEDMGVVDLKVPVHTNQDRATTEFNHLLSGGRDALNCLQSTRKRGREE